MPVTQKTTITLPISRTEALHIARLVTLPPNKVARAGLVRDLFGEDYIPGTFILAERKESPAFLWDDCDGDYENWIRAITQSHVKALLRAKFLRPPDAGFMEAVENATLAILDTPLESGLKLSERITNQQVTDIVWRILKALLAGDPYAPYHVFREFNELGHSYATGILRRESPNEPEPAFRRSIVAGSVGIDIKAAYTAVGPSPLVSVGVIRLSTSQGKRSLKSVQREIDLRAAHTFQIDCYDDFHRDVLTEPGSVSLLVFTDDYIETVFDLWAIQVWLLSKHDLKVTIVPKWGQHANDASFNDIMTLLNDPLFDDLNALRNTRFYVLPYGPAGSGINAYEFSPHILKALVSADVILFRGARAYEMVQGIKKVTFFAFNVLRSYTETLTGLDATRCPTVLLRQDAGVKSFNDFRARAERKHTLTSGRVIGLARMTALEYVEAIRSRHYAQLIREGGSRDAVNARIMERARTSGKTFAQIVMEKGSSLPDLPGDTS